MSADTRPAGFFHDVVWPMLLVVYVVGVALLFCADFLLWNESMPPTWLRVASDLTDVCFLSALLYERHTLRRCTLRGSDAR